MSFELVKKKLRSYFSLLAAAILSWYSYADGAPKNKVNGSHYHLKFVLQQLPRKDPSRVLVNVSSENSLEGRLTGTLLPTGLLEEMEKERIEAWHTAVSLLNKEKRIEECYARYHKEGNTLRNFTRTILRESYKTLITQSLTSAKEKYNVEIPYSLFVSLVQGESNWSTAVRSPAGAEGLMQFMPATSKAFGCTNPHSPKQLVCGGQFLARFYKHYEHEVPEFKNLPEYEKWNWVLLGYNRGPNSIPKLIRKTGAKTVWDLTRKHLGAEAYEFVPKIRGIERAYLRDYQHPLTS